MINPSDSCCSSVQPSNDALHVAFEETASSVENSQAKTKEYSCHKVSPISMKAKHVLYNKISSPSPSISGRAVMVTALALIVSSSWAMVSNSIPSYGRPTTTNNVYSSSQSSNALRILNTVQLLREERSRDNNQQSSNIKDNESINIPSLSSNSWTQTLFDEDEMGNDASNLLNQIQTSLLDQNLPSGKKDSRSGFFFNDKRKNTYDNRSTNTASPHEEDFISSRIQQQLPSVTKFRTSLGTEVPDIELHLQMEAARSRAAATPKKMESYDTAFAFMDLHHEQSSSSSPSNPDSPTTSVVEKLAMRSIPSQLPGPAASVMESKVSSNSVINTKKNQNRRKKKSTGASKKSSSRPSSSHKIKTKDISTLMATKKATKSNQRKEVTLQTPSERVSPEQEIQLARIVQRGVELHKLKTEFEKTHGRDITRQEWTDLAKLDSPKQLRRLVSSYRTAKNALVTANMGLVHAVVRSYMGSSWNSQGVTTRGVSYEEMVQEGSLGLLRAAELFDPNRGLRFSTYATIWIKGILGNNNLDETITLPLREKNKWNKIRKAKEDLSLENDENTDSNGQQYRPSKDDIASKCGLKSDDVRNVMSKMKTAKNVLSLDYQYDLQGRSGTESSDAGSLSNDKNMMVDVDLVEKLQLRADVVAALTRNLDPREARLMRLRYGLKDGQTRSIAACAEAMGISKARAQQLAAGCLKKLREADDAESLQEYLLSVA